MKYAVFTIVAKNYLAHARFLMECVARRAPEVGRFVVLVDDAEGCFDPSIEPFTVLRSIELPIPAVRWFHFKYTVLELSTAVKPYAAQVLLEQHGIDRLIYFDPDILLCESPEAIFRELDEADILLTPHLDAPIDDGCRPDELDILRSGAYNLGFVAMRRSESATALLAWWQRRLYDRCVVSPEQGLFVDQRWMDLAPGLFSGVKIIRDQGWNVAYWNLHSRSIRFVDENPFANECPLVFFHFSGFDPLRPSVFSKHQNRFLTRDLGDAARLVERYRKGLLRHGFAECKNWTYTWSRFSDGSPIPETARPVHHEDPSILDAVENPFSAEGREAFANAWNRPALDPQGNPSMLTRLARRIYSVRADVQQAMPDVFGADAQRFREWFVTSGEREHGLPEFLVEPMRIPVAADDGASGARARQSEGSEPAWLATLLWNISGLRRQLSARYEMFEFGTPEVLADIERYLAEPKEASDWATAPPRIAELIWAARPDVQARSKRAGRVDEGWYLAWALTYGRREYRLPRVVNEALEKAWGELGRTSGLAAGLRARLLRTAMAFSSWRRTVLAAAPQPRPGSTKTGDGHPAARQPASGDAASAGVGAATRAAREFGVNLVGYVRAEMGVGESVRLAHSALEAAGVPVAVRAISTNGIHAERDERLRESVALPYIFDVIHANADSFASAVSRALGPLHHPDFTVGYWAWELEEFPEHFDDAFLLCGEIWTPSEYCRRSIETRSPTPVVTIPHPIRTEIETSYGRDYFSLDADRFVFLCMVDMLSVPERKNPLGTIQAFLRAAPKMPNAELVVKVNNAQHDVAALDEIRAAAATGPVRVIEKVLSRAEVDSILECADCFVSLHRSEGFGLAMAESMAIGKPVVATAYSGNMDFMDERSAFLVDYEPGEVPAGCEPYRAGAVWAEPSIDHAAKQMLTVFSDSEMRGSIAASGRRRVREQLDPAVVGERILTRLRAMERRRKL